MPFQLIVHHPDRLVIGRATGEVTISDVVAFARDIMKDGMVHYRKVLDVIDARPAFNELELRAMATVARQTRTARRRGPVAFVVEPGRGEFARLFSELQIADRPAQVFTSIHEARKWLAQMPVED